jgi:hypothetical protein
VTEKESHEERLDIFDVVAVKGLSHRSFIVERETHC